MPTFAEYVPVVSAAVSAGTRRAYGSYWNRVLEQWGDRRLDEPTPSEIRQLMTYVKTHVVARRNARGGRSAEEHLVAALRCLYKRAVDDGLITEAGNPARKVAKPRRLPTTRRALPDTRLAEINAGRIAILRPRLDAARMAFARNRRSRSRTGWSVLVKGRTERRWSTRIPRSSGSATRHKASAERDQRPEQGGGGAARRCGPTHRPG